MRILGVLETAVYCGDLDAAEHFYGDVVGLERIARDARRHVFFRCGDGVLLVFDPAVTEVEASDVQGQLVPQHGSHGPGHVAFSVPADELDSWERHLSAHGIVIESEVEWPSGGRSVYVRDPAGNSVEFATPDIWR